MSSQNIALLLAGVLLGMLVCGPVFYLWLAGQRDYAVAYGFFVLFAAGLGAIIVQALRARK